MHSDVIIFCVCFFVIWLIGLQVFVYLLERYETRPDTPKTEIDVKVAGYDALMHPPLLRATTESGEIIFLNDYDKKFEFAAQVYYNRWTRITLVNHYYGVLIIRITKKVHSVVPVYK